MKKVLILCFLGCLITSAQNYWQQEVAYKMDINFDIKKHQFEGKQQLVYTNNSPDTLKQIFYHLYFNAFQPGSMMDTRAKYILDPDKRIGRRIEQLHPDEIGYQKILNLAQEGKPLNYDIEGTILQAQLNRPLLPGKSTTFEMKFKAQVPIQIRRSGRNNTEGVDYTMTQWYPKLAEYDKNGWHPNPYVAREFYAPYGSFDVVIEIDSNYKLGGTGELQNFGEYWELEKEQNGVKTLKYLTVKKKKRNWQFKGSNVHDFAWGADPDYIHTMMKGPNELTLHFYYQDSVAEVWEQLPGYTATFFELMNNQFGAYAYSSFSVIQGGDGGMEYPMCTMLKGTGKIQDLVSVMVHESAHSWFYGILGTDEFQYPWMDEGFTSYAEAEILNKMGEADPNPHADAYSGYVYMATELEIEPLTTPADYFSTNKSYGISAYSRGEIFLSQLKYVIGEKSFDKGMLEYYNKWKFKHPNPWDFLRIMEDVSGVQLDWYLNFWMNTNKTIDYTIEEVSSRDAKNKTIAKLRRIGEMPMPLDITITTKEGDKYRYHIPLVSMFGAKQDINVMVLKPWAWTSESYEWKLDFKAHEIKNIRIDPLLLMADINRANNMWTPDNDREKAKEKD